MEEVIAVNSPQKDITRYDENADKIIWKYSILAGVSGAIPIPGADLIVDVVGDTIMQYQMIDELKKNYQVDDGLDIKQIVAVVFDNLVTAKLVSFVTGLLKYIPVIGQTLIPFAKYIVDFGYTYLIGKVFKHLFREYMLNGTPVDLNAIPKLVQRMLDETMEFIRKNWKGILGTGNFVLKRYEVDLEALKNEIVNTNYKKDQVIENSFNKIVEIYKDLDILKTDNKDFMDTLSKIADEIGLPSLELIKTEIINAELKGEKVDPNLLATVELLENSKIVKQLPENIKKLEK